MSQSKLRELNREPVIKQRELPGLTITPSMIECEDKTLLFITLDTFILNTWVPEVNNGSRTLVFQCEC